MPSEIEYVDLWALRDLEFPNAVRADRVGVLSVKSPA